MHDLTQLVLHGGRGTVAEQPLELLGQVPVLGTEDLVDLRAEELRDDAGLVRERGLHLARDLLELVADVLRVHRRLLALEHARADLDRVRHDAHAALAGLHATGHVRGGRGIVDDDVVDDDAPQEDVDAGLAEGGGSFHDERVTVRAVPDGTSAQQTGDRVAREAVRTTRARASAGSTPAHAANARPEQESNAKLVLSAAGSGSPSAETRSGGPSQRPLPASSA